MTNSSKLAALKGDLPADIWRAATPNYLEEPRGRWQGKAAAVLAPRSTEEVAVAVRACAAHGVAVIPYGGGTGLVGGQLSESFDHGVILSMERMRGIRAMDEDGRSLTVEAGVILADIHATAQKAGLLFPLSLASQGSARIGGLLATNAGGVNVLRYGNARDLVLGIEAVMPDGSIYHGLSPLRKNNTGYDLRHLLIGSEGTLGVITAASLRLFPEPAAQGAALMAVSDPHAALSLLRMAQDQVGEALSAFELMHRQGFDFLAEVGPDLRQPFDEIPDWSVLIDLGCGAGQDPAALLERLFADAFEAGLVSDGVIAQSMAQRDDFWALRENIPEANRRIGAVSSHDISLPVGLVPQFIDTIPAHMAQIGDFRHNCFGHMGDGNLHYNIFPVSGKTRADHVTQRDEIKRVMHDLVHQMGGSVSAEHGIGRLKVDDLERYGDPAKLAAMRAIKMALDPQGIMNPGAVLRANGG
ncbi:FAD-binding oxidoreductase [Rhodobacteraceae bacterium XHP0102]|nr:FAD-binding oxidoreductase [Rhodobacteraceae bacterium XHP0102]